MAEKVKRLEEEMKNNDDKSQVMLHDLSLIWVSYLPAVYVCLESKRKLCC